MIATTAAASLTALHLSIVIGLLVPSVAASQTSLPEPAGSAAGRIVRAGVPLRDGALPPGSLRVRVVRGAFAGDLTGMAVEVEVAGQPSIHAITGAKGRANFAHLPIGVQVRALTVVDGERLHSEPFPMPAETGVRVLLATTGGVTGVGKATSPPILTLASPRAPAPSTTAEPPVNASNGVMPVQGAVVALTMLAFLLIGGHRWTKRRRRIRDQEPAPLIPDQNTDFRP